MCVFRSAIKKDLGGAMLKVSVSRYHVTEAAQAISFTDWMSPRM